MEQGIIPLKYFDKIIAQKNILSVDFRLRNALKLEIQISIFEFELKYSNRISHNTHL